MINYRSLHIYFFIFHDILIHNIVISIYQFAFPRKVMDAESIEKTWNLAKCFSFKFNNYYYSRIKMKKMIVTNQGIHVAATIWTHGIVKAE